MLSILISSKSKLSTLFKWKKYKEKNVFKRVFLCMSAKNEIKEYDLHRGGGMNKWKWGWEWESVSEGWLNKKA